MTKQEDIKYSAAKILKQELEADAQIVLSEQISAKVYIYIFLLWWTLIICT